jgi:hypothetical protein
MNKIYEFLKRNWSDPVWSKVISAIIIGIGSFILGAIWFGLKSLIDKRTIANGWQAFISYLNTEQTITGKRVLFILGLIILIVLLLPFCKSLYNLIVTSFQKSDAVIMEEDDELQIMHDRSTVFLDNRMADAFPGLRGIKWYKGADAVSRLTIMLKKPLRFSQESPQINDPIWWFRGGRNSSISNCRAVSRTKILFDHHEYIIDQIAVYRDDHPEKNFIYIKAKADSPVGAYKYTKDHLKWHIDTFGYHREEYGLINKKYPVSREQYDDGAAEIKGKIIERKSSELRSRYLTKYNFIIAAKQSAVNSRRFDMESEDLLNGLLSGKHTFEELFSFVQELDESICK